MNKELALKHGTRASPLIIWPIIDTYVKFDHNLIDI